MKEILAK